MILKNVLIILFLCSFGSVFAQKEQTLVDFKISGRINIDTGTVELKMEGGKELFPAGFENIKAKVKNGQFEMIGKTDSPIWIRFTVRDKYTSSRVAIMPGTQSVVINVDSAYESPATDNAIMKDVEAYNKFCADAANKTIRPRFNVDSLRKTYGSKKLPDDVAFLIQNEVNRNYADYDSTLLKFIKAYPESHYGLFLLDNLIFFGYNPTIGAAADQMSSNVRDSKLGISFLKKITLAKQFSVGFVFPEFEATNIKGEKLNSKLYSKNKFTLIDFWYSHCSPCIAQFDDLKEIYANYSIKGFEILAVSVDKEKDRKDWQDAILKYGLNWPQYLDVNGTETRKINIRVFPSNFLINSKGIIVGVNLRPIELKYFLKENIK